MSERNVIFGPQTGAGKLFVPVAVVIGVIGIVVLQFGFIFLLLALLPSLVAYYIDGNSSRSTFKVVFASNVAAILPFLIPMLRAIASMKHYDTSFVMSRPDVWLIIYSGAAAGWCVIYLCRFIARFGVTIAYQQQIISLERMQKRLVEEWGHQVVEKNV